MLAIQDKLKENNKKIQNMDFQQNKEIFAKFHCFWLHLLIPENGIMKIVWRCMKSKFHISHLSRKISILGKLNEFCYTSLTKHHAGIIKEIILFGFSDI